MYVKNLLRAEPDDPRVVFILGSGHCGSTLLNLLLNGHPELVGLSELSKLAEAMSNVAARERILADPLWAQVDAQLRDRVGEGLDDLDVHHPPARTFLRWNRTEVEQWGRRYRGLVSSVLEVSGKSAVVDASKSWQQLYLLERSSGLDLQVIHLLRDGRGVVNSYARKYGRFLVGYRKWVKSTLAGLFLARSFGDLPWRRLRYEDLTATPEAELRSLCRWLNLDFDAGMLRFRDHRDHGFSGNRMAKGTDEEIRPDARWRSELKILHRVAFAVLGGWLNRLTGYR